MKPYCPSRLRSDLLVREQVHRGEDVCVVKDPVTRRYFRLPAEAHRAARLFDEQSSVEQLAVELSTLLGRAVDSAEVEAFARMLEGLGLLDQQRTPAEIVALQKKAASDRQSIFYRKWPLLDPDRLLDRLLLVFRPLISAPFVVVLAGLVCAAGVLHVVHSELFARALSAAVHGSGLVWLYGATVVTLTIHELAHGLTSKRFGAEVHEMGFMLLYFMPCAYTDISDAYLLDDKRHRIGIALAGVAADLLVWAAASLVVAFGHPGPTGLQILGALLLTTGFRSVALNLNPLIKLDGYYVLTDLIEMPNLRHRSRRVIAWRAERWLGRQVEPPDETARDRRALEIYGWLSTAYVVALLSVTAVWVDRWLVDWAGACGRFGYLAIGLALAARWHFGRRRFGKRRILEPSTENEGVP